MKGSCCCEGVVLLLRDRVVVKSSYVVKLSCAMKLSCCCEAVVCCEGVVCSERVVRCEGAAFLLRCVVNGALRNCCVL